MLPSVAQPPLPLHEFLPLQPLSPVLQAPLPLQEFAPLQECVSLSFFLPISSDTPALLFDVAACACTANEPLIRPAIAAPAINAFFVMWTFLFCLVVPAAAQYRPESLKLIRNPVTNQCLFAGIFHSDAVFIAIISALTFCTTKSSKAR